MDSKRKENAETMSYFPMFVQLENLSCLVVGGGRIALRKILVLMDFGANVTVVAEELLDEIDALKGVRCVKKSFAPQDLTGIGLAVAATDDKALNRRIAQACRERGIPVNAVDQAEDCSFIFPAYLKQGEVVAAFSSGGQSPVIAQYLKKETEPFLTPLLGRLAACLGGLRETVKDKVKRERDRKRFYQELLSLGLEKKDIPPEKDIETLIGRYKDGT